MPDLFGWIRSPSYFGEMTFWLGAFVSGIPAYTGLLAWLIALVGLVCIELIMLGSARRLELKQAERYGGTPEFEAYVKQVPILLPFVPLYSLRDLKIYLG
jgi:steroid 5-alpha reductase family enzyme